MASIITVHGTNDSGPVEGNQWWQKESFFEQDLRSMVEAEDGKLSVDPIVWDGLNSETSRRVGAEALGDKIKELEGRGEAYTIVGHSHGGSVIAAGLIEAVLRGQSTDRLRTWITVGTPFLTLRRQRMLFFRIPTYKRSIFVGLFSLILMFLTMGFLKLIYSPAEILAVVTGSASSNILDTATTSLMVFLSVSGVFLLFYIFLAMLDRRRFRRYGRRQMQEADRRFTARWLSLTHEDDEAVRGLATLGSTKAPIFHRDFAIPLFASAAVFVLPLIYFVIVFSPALSAAVTKVITTSLYHNDDYASLAAQEFKKRAEIAALRDELMGVIAGVFPDRPVRRPKREQPAGDPDARTLPRSDQSEERRTERWSPEQFEARRQQFQQRRAEIEAKATPEQRASMAEISARLRQAAGELQDIRRVQSFKQDFLDDQGNVIGGGRNPAKNSELIFRVVTTEVVTLFKQLFDDRMVRRSWYVEVGSFLLVFLVVPSIFALVSLVILYAFRFLAYRLSGRISVLLDTLTWSELRRSAFGNDTIAEVATGAQDHPQWTSVTRPFLPKEVAEDIANRSNEVAAVSIAKLRNAISELAFAEGASDHASLVAQYITWQELIHTTYFYVPRFRKLLAYAICQADGFRASAAFRADPDYERIVQWYGEIAHSRAAAEV